MKAVQRQLNEINRLKAAIKITKSNYLKNDYSKHIKTLKAELKEYCGYRGYDFNKIMKQNNVH